MLDLFSPLLFLYFFTLHADQLSLHVGDFTIRVNNLIALALFVGLALRFRRGLLALPRPLFVALALLSIGVLISTGLSPHRMRVFVFCNWWFFTLLCYFLLPYFVTKLLGRDAVLRLYLLSFVAVGAVAVIQLLVGFTGVRVPFVIDQLFPRCVRPNAFCYECSYYALYMTPFFIYAQLSFLTRPSSLKRSAALFGIYLFYFCSMSTSAFITTLLVFLILLCLIRYREFFPDLKRRLLQLGAFFGSALTLTVLMVPKVTQVFFKFFTSKFFLHHSFNERWIGITHGWRLFWAHPWFGIGLGGAPAELFLEWQRRDPRYNLKYYDGMLKTYGNGLRLKPFELSNVTMELLASLGLLGALAFGTLLFYYGRVAIGRIRDRGLSLEERRLSLILALSMALTFMTLQINQGLLRTYIWVHFALTLAYLEGEKRPTTASEQALQKYPLDIQS